MLKRNNIDLGYAISKAKEENSAQKKVIKFLDTLQQENSC